MTPRSRAGIGVGIGAVVLALACLVVTLVLRAGSATNGAQRASAAPAQSSGVPSAAVGEASLAEPASNERVAVPAPPDVTSRRSGVLLDAQGEGLVGVNLRFVRDGASPHALTTGEGGRFAVPLSLSGSTCEVADDRYVLLNVAQWSGDGPLTLIAATLRVVRGVVVSESDKTPLADVTVTLHDGAQWTRLLADDRTWRGFERHVGKSDQRGEFEFPDVVDVAGGFVDANHAGFTGAGVPLVPGPQFVGIELTPTSGRRLRGVVLDAGGKGVAAAVVGIGEIGEAVAHTDGDGRFELYYETKQAPRELRAVARGLGAVSHPIADAAAFLVVRMPPELHRVMGLVVDQDGAPVEDALVDVGRTLVGSERAASRLGIGEYFRRICAEEVLNDDLHDLRTGSDGTFTLVCAGAGPMSVTVVDPVTVARDRQAMAPGAVTRFVLSRSDLQEVRCLVVDDAGVAVAGADVMLGLPMYQRLATAALAKTDADGRCTFAVSRSVEELVFLIHGEGLVRKFAKVPLAGPEVRLVMERSRAVRLLWSAARPGSHVTAETADGEPVGILTVTDRLESLESQSIEVRGDCSHVVQVSERAAFWTWLDREGHVQRTPFVPERGAAVTEVRF